MKKRAAALSMAFLMAASTCFPAQAGWVRGNGIWRYTDNAGEFEKNVLRPSGGRWFWIGEDTYLKTGHEGETVKADLNGKIYILTLNDNGSAKPACRDEEGNTYDLYDLIGREMEPALSSTLLNGVRYRKAPIILMHGYTMMNPESQSEPECRKSMDFFITLMRTEKSSQ